MDCNHSIKIKTIAHHHISADIDDFNTSVNALINSTSLHSNSAYWQSAYTTVNTNSAAWINVPDTLMIAKIPASKLTSNILTQLGFDE